jgi:hypothetical protein
MGDEMGLERPGKVQPLQQKLEQFSVSEHAELNAHQNAPGKLPTPEQNCD